MTGGRVPVSPAPGVAARRQHLRVDGPRLLARIERLRAVGATPAGGVSRLAFTPDDTRGRELVASYLRAAGMGVEVDPAGNLIGRRLGARPDRPWLVLGSHLDTVPDGGPLDGAYGVLAAVEVAHVLAEHGVEMGFPVAVIGFMNEEGAFGTPGMWGSHAFAGQFDRTWLSGVDSRGEPVRDLLRAAGGDPGRVPRAAWPDGSVGAYLELHIEQGPVLETEGYPIGVVTAITGRVTIDVTVRGQANHAGTTPIALRRDALVAAAQFVLAVRDIAGEDGIVRVATVGCCTVEPDAWNVVPGLVRLRADLRDVAEESLDAAVEALRRVAEKIGAETGTVVELAPSQVVQPMACDGRLRRLISAASDALGLPYHHLPSGAGHDAQIVGRLAPMAMIFVPSQGGRSHVATESTAPEDIVAGANVLLHTVLGYDPEVMRGHQ
ncbi:Zn-dependent hydrolase [Micromonospora sp. KC606]|uniref:Zn-dependent hydrolase n=1 Tax=Micromonospora sp. KC606 TaxID=2530379 RepID=UPI001404E6CD|nr:Zn-dependent hydrolase [Micromonospora sp. KC606]